MPGDGGTARREVNHQDAVFVGSADVALGTTPSLDDLPPYRDTLRELLDDLGYHNDPKDQKQEMSAPRPARSISPANEKEGGAPKGSAGKIKIKRKARLYSDDPDYGFYSPYNNSRFPNNPGVIDPSTRGRIPHFERAEDPPFPPEPVSEHAWLDAPTTTEQSPGHDKWFEDQVRHTAEVLPVLPGNIQKELLDTLRRRGREMRRSRLYEAVRDDVDAILASRENPEKKFALPSAEIFFRVEGLMLQRARGWSFSAKLPHETIVVAGQDLHGNLVGQRTSPMDIPKLPDEVVETDLYAEYLLEFERIEKGIKDLQEKGASEGVLFKKILKEVASIPYRKSANSLAKALAGKTRESLRKKRGFLYELRTASSRPGINCEGRAKMFCVLLEAAGYDPETEIFLNWPEVNGQKHVQTLLKRKDGTWLAFEGNAKRPFIQRFYDSTSGVCSLREWEYTLYGVPTAKVIESVDISPVQSPPLNEEETAGEAEKKEKVEEREEWEEKTLQESAEEAAEALVEAASDFLGNVYALFAAKPDDSEWVKSAYPVFAPSERSGGSGVSGDTAAREIQEKRNIVGGHIEVVQKLLAPKILAAHKALKEKWPFAIAPIGMGCFLAYGSLFEGKDGPEPWIEAVQAVADDAELQVTIVSPPEQDADWEMRLKRQALDAPYSYGELDFLFETNNGFITEQKVTDGKIVHVVQLSDEVRTLLPDVFDTMVKKDFERWAERREDLQESVWVVRGAHLHTAAAEQALSRMKMQDSFLVDAGSRSSGMKKISLKETWIFQGEGSDETVSIEAEAGDSGELRRERPLWKFSLVGDSDMYTLRGAGRVASHVLIKQFGRGDYYAPVDAISLEEKENIK